MKEAMVVILGHLFRIIIVLFHGKIKFKLFGKSNGMLRLSILMVLLIAMIMI